MDRAGLYIGVFTPCLLIMFAGCAEVDTGFSAVQETIGDTYNAAEKTINDALAERGNRYCLQAGGLSALAGAAAGAGAGYALTRDYTGALIGATIGAIGGAIAGCKYGVWVADRRQTYDSESEQLNAELENAVKTNNSLADLNQQLRSGLTEREKQLVQLQKMQGQADQKRLAKEQLATEIKANRKGVEEQLDQAEKELAIHKATLVQLQNNSMRTSNSKAALMDLEKTSKNKTKDTLTDIAPGNQAADERVKIAEYKKNISEMTKAISDLRTVNEQYAKVDSRVGVL